MGESTRKLPLRAVIAAIAVILAACFAIMCFSYSLSARVSDCCGEAYSPACSVSACDETDGATLQKEARFVNLLAAETSTDEINANLETIYKLLFLLFASDLVIALIVIVAVVMSLLGKSDSDKKGTKENCEKKTPKTSESVSADEKHEPDSVEDDSVKSEPAAEEDSPIKNESEPAVETAEAPKPEFDSPETAMQAAIGEFDTEEEPLLGEDEDDEDELASTEFSPDGDAFALMRKRSTKTFADRLAEADEQTKANYEEIKNELLSFKKVKSRMSRKCESYRVGRVLLAKVMFSGKSIKCYFALEPAAYETSVFHHRDVSEKKSYVDVPMLVRVRSNRSVKNAKRLVAEVAEKNELVKKS